MTDEAPIYIKVLLGILCIVCLIGILKLILVIDPDEIDRRSKQAQLEVMNQLEAASRGVCAEYGCSPSMTEVHLIIVQRRELVHTNKGYEKIVELHPVKENKQYKGEIK